MKTTTKFLALALVTGSLHENSRAAVDATFGGLSGNSYTASWTGSRAILDNNLSGMSFNLDFNHAGAAPITGMSVSFTINGGWNGDMYAYLTHGSDVVVLLNRIGRDTGSPDGSGTSGFNLNNFTLSSAAVTDVHAAPGTTGDPLVGTYAPDGRFILPTEGAASFHNAPRDATFQTVLGDDPNGSWMLFFADAGQLNMGTLTDFRVVVEVPEPVTWALIGFGALFGTVQLVRYYRGRLATVS